MAQETPQLQTLLALYEGMGDEQLLALHDQLDDLTDTAQQALIQVVQARKLQPQPDSAHPPATAPDAEWTAELAGEPGPDEACIWTFDDAFQLSEAMRLLTAASIPARVLDWNSGKQTDPFRGRAISMGVIIQRTDLVAAKALLQREMNLFPPPESGDASIDAEWMQVGVFERADALAVAHALGQGGVSYRWLDPTDDPDGEPDQVAIEVLGVHLDHAQHLAQAAFNDLP